MKNESETMNSSMNDTDSLKINAIFGGVKKNFASANFKGGSINAVFGGAEIDMRQATLAPGVNKLEMNCVLGGASLLIPSDWDVKIEATTILGGFADERKVSFSNKTGGSLVITGIAVLGGGEIKS